MTRRFTNDELMVEVRKVRSMMREVENDMDGQYELLEDHLSELLEDIKERIIKIEEFCSTAEFDNQEAWEEAEMEKEEMLEVLYDEEQYQGDTDGDN